MGWFFYTDRRVQTYTDEKAEIARLCTFESDTRKTELVKACKVGSTWYAAAKITSIDGSSVEDATYVTDADGSITFGAVFLTRYDDGCWGYKDMEESAGPVESRAPLSLLALLSDLKDPDSYAHAWRQRCRDWAAIPDYEEGDKIKLADPVTLTDGSTCQIVTATHDRRGGKNAAATASRKPVGSYACRRPRLRARSCLAPQRARQVLCWPSLWRGRGNEMEPAGGGSERTFIINQSRVSCADEEAIQFVASISGFVLSRGQNFIGYWSIYEDRDPRARIRSPGKGGLGVGNGPRCSQRDHERRCHLRRLAERSRASGPEDHCAGVAVRQVATSAVFHGSLGM